MHIESGFGMRNIRILALAVGVLACGAGCGPEVKREYDRGLRYSARGFEFDDKYSQWRRTFDNDFLALPPTKRYKKLRANFDRLEARRKAGKLTAHEEFDWLLTVGTINASVTWPIDFETYPQTLTHLEESDNFEVLRARWLSDRRYMPNSILSLSNFGQRLLVHDPFDFWVLNSMAILNGTSVGGDQTAADGYIAWLGSKYPKDSSACFRWAKMYEFRFLTGGRKSDLNDITYFFKQYSAETQDPPDFVKAERDYYAYLMKIGPSLVTHPRD